MNLVGLGIEEAAAASLHCDAQIAYLPPSSHLGASYPTSRDSRNTNLVLVAEGRDGLAQKE